MTSMPEMKKWKVYYVKDPEPLWGLHASLESREKHVFVKEIEAERIEPIFGMMQGENNPFGEPEESNAYLDSLGLYHTSLTIGDVVEDDQGKFYECDRIGWREVPNSSQSSEIRDASRRI